MTTSSACQYPGCSAPASDEAFCERHAEFGRRLVFDDLAELTRKRFPRVTRFLIGIDRVSLPIPGLLQYGFHSPYARLLISEDLPSHEVASVFFHQLAHLAQQLRLFRRRTRVGVATGRKAPWADVQASAQQQQPPISEEQFRTLCEHAGNCPACGRAVEDLSWVYFRAPGHVWAGMAGFAGWMAVCTDCPEQVALFVDQQN